MCLIVLIYCAELIARASKAHGAPDCPFTEAVRLSRVLIRLVLKSIYNLKRKEIKKMEHPKIYKVKQKLYVFERSNIFYLHLPSSSCQAHDSGQTRPAGDEKTSCKVERPLLASADASG